MALIPTPVVDKNGKLTTVHKRAFAPNSPSFDAPPVITRQEILHEEWETNPLVDQMRESIDFILIDLEGSEFANQNLQVSKPMLGIADLADGELAANNCYDASKHVINSGALSHLDDIEKTSIITVSDGDSEYHSAIYLKDKNGNEMVLDFTARQFDPGAQFPVAVTLGDWESFMETSMMVLETEIEG